MRASKLRLRVSAGGSVRADLTFPATAAAGLPAMVPAEAVLQLAARGIDPAAIAAQAVAAGFPVGHLFALDTGAKHVRVWLE